jgi:hypothetical protein
LADLEAQTGAAAAFAVEGQDRVLVEHIVDVGDDESWFGKVRPALRLTNW